MLLALLPLQALPQSVNKPAAAPARQPKADPRVALASKIPGTKVEDLRATPVPGIYELTHDDKITYVSADGKYVFSGDLYQVVDHGDFPNLTEVRRHELEGHVREQRVRLLAAVPESEMVVFSPKDPKYTITVFTDVDCTWCRKLHSQIAEYNRLGVRVRYMSWPRSGPATDSWYKAEGVWCSANRGDALTRAKRGEPVKRASCAQDPVKRHYELGRELGVTGTPGLILANGELVPGYVGPAELVEHLQEVAAAK